MNITIDLGSGTTSGGTTGSDGITPHIGENGNWFLGDEDTGVAATGPQGEQGETGPAGADGATGATGADGEDGEDGVGIENIERTLGDGSAGTTDTYTITLTDGSTSTFTVYNGADGADGSGGDGTASNVYTSLEDIGLVTGSETLADIAVNLPENSVLILSLGDSNNASAYPTTNGFLRVVKAETGYVTFDVFKEGSYTRYFAGYDSEDGTATSWVTAATTSSTTKSAYSLTLQNANQLRFAKPSEGTEVQVAGAWNDGTNSSRITGYRFLDGNSTMVPIYASELYEGDEAISAKYAVAEHTHEIADITGLQDALGNGTGTSSGSGIVIDSEEPTEGDVWIDTDEEGEDGTVVYSFNGRVGAIVPQAGDYTAEMVGAATVEDIQAAILDSWEKSY